jgi:outer membrane protein OmpA-like peptidoglycan-associated protein
LDKDDNCPDTAGTVANDGCPEVTEEVQKQLNEYARTINFDTGKSSIKAESTSVMVDIIQILNEYPNSKFTVEGHTDSVGSDELNKSLSESRALSVKDFLVDKGIEEFRLSAIGYGEEKPIATNNTRAGRAENRRVEINLVKE